MHVNLGGYHIRDIEFSAAIDIDENKVGKDLVRGDLRLAQQHHTSSPTCRKPGVTVQRGMTHDGLGKYLSQIITEGARARPVDIVKHPQGHQDRRGGQLPAGRLAKRPPSGTSSRSSRPAARFVNCIPVFIAREQYWQQRFEERGLPIIGDDIKSQVGATITHRVLTRLFGDRGVQLDRTYQLNFGGNTDFLNMLERERLESKKISKTNAVTSQLDYELAEDERPRRAQRLRAVAARTASGATSAWRARPSATCRSTSR